MMTRRSFLSSSSLSLAAVSVVPASLVLTGCDTSWIATAEQDAPAILSIVSSVLQMLASSSLVDPTMSSTIQTTLGLVTIGVNTLLGLLKQYNTSASPTVIGQINAVLADLSANLHAVLTNILQIENPDLLAAISAGVNGAIAVISTIELLIPTTKAGAIYASSPSVNKVKVVLIKPDQLKSNYNMVLLAHGYAKYAVN